MMFNRTEAVRTSTARQGQLIDPTSTSGSHFYSVPDPYEEGRRRAAEEEKKRGDSGGESESGDS